MSVWLLASLSEMHNLYAIGSIVDFEVIYFFKPKSTAVQRINPLLLLFRCCCGRLMGEHSWQDSAPPISLYPDPGQDLEEEWSTELHTKASLTNAYGVIDFEDTATRVCRAKVGKCAPKA